MSALFENLREFLEYLEVERGRSKLTIRNYEFYLTRFLAWLKGKLGRAPKAEDITAEEIRLFRLWLNRFRARGGQELLRSTQNYHLIAVRSFLKYLSKREIPSLAAERVELGKMPDRHVAFLSGEELGRFLEAPFMMKQPEQLATRDKAILELLFSTGMRVSELVSLRRDDIELGRGEIGITGRVASGVWSVTPWNLGLCCILCAMKYSQTHARRCYAYSI